MAKTHSRTTFRRACGPNIGVEIGPYVRNFVGSTPASRTLRLIMTVEEAFGFLVRAEGLREKVSKEMFSIIDSQAVRRN